MPSKRISGAFFLVGFFFATILSFPSSARAVVTFTDINAGLPGSYYGSAEWGDYDGDGDLDLVLLGDSFIEPVTRIYRNDGASFSDAGIDLPGLMYGNAVWGDCDGDGDLDLLISGRVGPDSVLARVYRNNGVFGFHDIQAGLPNKSGGSDSWADYDNDGDLDILLTGTRADAGEQITRLLRNDGSNLFTEVATGFPDLSGSDAAWGDYDNDGDLDLLLTGFSLPGLIPHTLLYRNDGGTFAEVPAGLEPQTNGAVAWGDYDGDGDLDLAQSGFDSTQIPGARIYRNDGNAVFTDIGAGLLGMGDCDVAWGDYDNDGDLDLLHSGLDASWDPVTLLYRNDGGDTFTPLGGTGLNDIGEGSVAWGDYDNDRDLDLVQTGRAGGYVYCLVYNSYGAEANAPPGVPTGLSATLVGDRVLLSWLPSTDAETPASGLTYNLRVGTSSGGSQIVSAMANPVNGYRRVVANGNAQERLSWALDIRAEVYYWSVQAIDGAFAGSVFAEEQTVPLADVEDLDGANQVRLHPSLPNPFTGEAVISYELAESGPVRLAVYDASGRCVRVLLEQTAAAGPHTLRWDGTDNQGRAVAAGSYLCRLVTGGTRETTGIVRIE